MRSTGNDRCLAFLLAPLVIDNCNLGNLHSTLDRTGAFTRVMVNSAWCKHDRSSLSSFGVGGIKIMEDCSKKEKEWIYAKRRRASIDVGDIFASLARHFTG